MKKLDYVLIALIGMLVSVGVLAVLDKANTVDIVIPFTQAAIVLVYMIVCIVTRTKLSRKNAELLLLDTDTTSKFEQCSLKLEKATARIAGDKTQYEQQITELDAQVLQLRAVLDAKGIKLCECGSAMRETKAYFICDDCKTRVKKETEKETEKVIEE